MGQTWTDRMERDYDKLKQDVAVLEAVVARLPSKDDVNLAMLANGGVEFQQDYCNCDSSVGMSPCQYCAIHDVLRRVNNAVEAAQAAGR
jgi:hypothetical protein